MCEVGSTGWAWCWRAWVDRTRLSRVRPSSLSSIPGAQQHQIHWSFPFRTRAIREQSVEQATVLQPPLCDSAVQGVLQESSLGEAPAATPLGFRPRNHCDTRDRREPLYARPGRSTTGVDASRLRHEPWELQKVQWVAGASGRRGARRVEPGSEDCGGFGVKLSVTYHMTPGLAMPPLELGVALVAAIVGAQVRGPVEVRGQGRLDSLRHGGW